MQIALLVMGLPADRRIRFVFRHICRTAEPGLLTGGNTNTLSPVRSSLILGKPHDVGARTARRPCPIAR
jgi:hypothetical protein